MLETSFLAHTHILPATLQTFSLALTHTHTSFYARDIFSSTYAHISGYARDILSCTHTHTSFHARDIFSCTYAHTHATLQMFFVAHTHTSCVAIYIFSCTYPHTWCYARDIFSCTYTQRKKRRALKKLRPAKCNGMLQWVFKIPGIFQGAILTWNDYVAVAPSTFDSKTCTTASAIVIPPGCLCLLGFTETIPTSFKS